MQYLYRNCCALATVAQLRFSFIRVVRTLAAAFLLLFMKRAVPTGLRNKFPARPSTPPTAPCWATLTPRLRRSAACAVFHRCNGKPTWVTTSKTLRYPIIAATILLATLATAQVLKRPHDDTQNPDQNQTKINAKKPKNYPRAIAVIEFLPGGGARLVPVALWINDRFYDASLYGANPAPMAVQPETIYEATNYGESVGLFTVTTPEELKGSWIAQGKWKPHQALDEKLAAQAAKQPKPNTTDDVDSDGGRPVLHRSGSSGSSSSGASSSSSSGSGGTSAGNTGNS